MGESLPTAADLLPYLTLGESQPSVLADVLGFPPRLERVVTMRAPVRCSDGSETTYGANAGPYPAALSDADTLREAAEVFARDWPPGMVLTPAPMRCEICGWETPPGRSREARWHEFNLHYDTHREARGATTYASTLNPPHGALPE